MVDQHDRAMLPHAIAQWGFGIVAGGLVFGSLWATQAMCRRDAMAIRSGAGAGALSLALVGNIARREFDKLAAIADGVRAVTINNTIGWQDLATKPNRTMLRQMESVPMMSAAAMPLFDWSVLADPDAHPTLAIISPMGGGKSRLAKFLARHVLFPGQSPELRSLDIYGRPADWNDATLITDHDAMLISMAADLRDIADRIAQYRTGKDDFPPLFWIFEEAPDTIGTLRKMGKTQNDLVTAWFTKSTTVARKVKARLCLVSVRLSGAEIGVSAEARNDATVIFPGEKGVSKAMTDDRIFKLGAKQNRDLREQLAAALRGVKRPALIYSDGLWYPGEIPDLDAGGNPIGYQPQRQIEPEPVTVIDPIAHLEASYAARPETDADELSPTATALSQYLGSKVQIEVRKLQQNWKYQGQRFNQQQLFYLLAELESFGLIQVDGEIVRWLNT
jgi:hypothetical protein